jgi:hypothetical protein
VADELQIQFVVPGAPSQVQATWRAEPPAPVRDGGYEAVDESYNSLVWEARYYDPIGKFMRVLSFGMFSDFFENIWRMTAHFDAESATRTRVTIIGNAHEDTRAAFRELAAEYGGATGLAVGV